MKESKDSKELSLAEAAKEAKVLLSERLEDTGLSEYQKKQEAKYLRMYNDVVAGMSVSDVAKKYSTSRNTVYRAMEYFKVVDLVKDKDINLAIALNRIRWRIKHFSQLLNNELSKPIFDTKKVSVLAKELRLNEEDEMRILGLMQPEGKNGENGKMVVVMGDVGINFPNGDNMKTIQGEAQEVKEDEE